VVALLRLWTKPQAHARSTVSGQRMARLALQIEAAMATRTYGAMNATMPTCVAWLTMKQTTKAMVYRPASTTRVEGWRLCSQADVPPNALPAKKKPMISIMCVPVSCVFAFST
jgi:hypothetical protein